MKKYLPLLKAGFCLLSLLAVKIVTAADNPAVEKRKSYNKSYSISGTDKVSLNNKFGEIIVSGWNKSEIKVEVTIIAKSSTDERAQQIIDRIDIEDGKTSGGIYFKTNMKNDRASGRERKNHKDEKMEINYQVYMPVSNALTISNEFGATKIPDMTGVVDIKCKFGTLTVGKLSNLKKLSVEFGSADIESVSNGTVIIKFSRAIINKLGGSVDAVFEHSSGIKLGVENDTRSLNVTSAFSTVYLDTHKDLSATFEINTSFGGLSNKTDFDIQESEKTAGKKPNFNHNYSGKAGSGNNAMRINSSFSNIMIGHNLTMDLQEDTKEKKRSTTI